HPGSAGVSPASLCRRERGRQDACAPRLHPIEIRSKIIKFLSAIMRMMRRRLETMKKLTARVPGTTMLIVLLITTGLLAVPSGAQDRLKTMPGYEQYKRISKEIPGAV